MGKTTEAIVDEVREVGFCVLPSILSESECEHFRSRIEHCYERVSPFHEKSNPNVAAFHGTGDVRMLYNLHNKHLSFFDLIEHPCVFAAVERLLQLGSYQESEPIRLHTCTARSPSGKCSKQQLHIDSNLPGATYPLVVQVIWAIDEFTDQNGATRVVPGSHRRPAFAENGVTYDDEQILAAPKGSAVVYDGGLWHGSSENVEGGDRWAIVCTFSRWFMLPAFDFVQNTSPELFEKLTDRQRDLLGFRCCPPKDEFTRLSRRSENFAEPQPYSLPRAKDVSKVNSSPENLCSTG